MKIDVDTKERIKIFLVFLLQSYKVIMGSLLVLFVPQLCDNEKVCSLTDNLFKQDLLHIIALIFNFITVSSFCICYTIELKRENWCIEYLDIDKNFGDHYLPNVLKDRPELEKSLHKINNNYYYSSRVTALLYFINLILSSISIYFYNTGVPTITAYMSFVILISMKLYNSIHISTDSKNNNMALSSYMTELQSFNVIDRDHRLSNKDNSEPVNDNEILVADLNII